MEEQQFTVDFGALLTRLDTEIAQAVEQLARLRGRREGVLLAIEEARRHAPKISTGEEPSYEP